jgi:hypothetical protein
MICPVLKLREKKRTSVKVGGGKVDFFLIEKENNMKAYEKLRIKNTVLITMAMDCSCFDFFEIYK